MAKNDLLKKEDWLAVWIGFIVIAVGCLSVLTGWFDFSAMKFSTWVIGEEGCAACRTARKLDFLAQAHRNGARARNIIYNRY